MTASSHLRGHPIEWDALRCEWVYRDNRDSTAETWRERPCGHCGEHGTTEGHDACLGTLPGAMNACCGHGCEGEAYVQHHDGECVRGPEALELIKQLKATLAGEEGIMNEFKREERYIVIKLKDLNEEMLDHLRGNLIGIRTRECVVVEPHHPHYEETWESVQRVVEGRPTIGEERDALAAHLSALKSAFQQEESPIDPDGVLHHVMMRAPDASLARRDARVVADALDNLLPVAKACRDGYVVETIETNIIHLRRQAEGGDA